MLQIKNLSYKLARRWLLQDLNVCFSCGELTVVAGENGAGKSTFLKLLGGTFPLTLGTILWKDAPLENHHPKKWAIQRAFLSQHQQLYLDLNGYETVMMGRYPHFRNRPTLKDHQAVIWAMEQTSVSSLQGTSYSKLSGGERQRIHFARVLAQIGPPEGSYQDKLLLLDEPTNSLDISHQYKCMQIIKDFTKKGGTAIVVLHDIDKIAEFADKILLLRNGNLVAFGLTSEVLSERILSFAFSCPVKVGEHPFRDHSLICFNPIR